jgi:hypothetical protein
MLETRRILDESREVEERIYHEMRIPAIAAEIRKCAARAVSQAEREVHVVREHDCARALALTGSARWVRALTPAS